MTSEKGSKINRLLRKWPSGAVAVSPWLEKQGVYQQLVHEYEKNSWLRRIGQGAYARLGDKVDWTGALYAIQEQMGLPIHAGGKTALQMLGLAHYLPLGKDAVVSWFGPPGVRLPTWFKQYQWDVKVRYTATNLFAGDPNQGLTKGETGFYSFKLSTRERAIMEVLYLVPRAQSYEEARLLMEGLTTLRPRVVESLVTHCTSVKVKRLFMVLAEGCRHPWVKRLDLSGVDFGKGKRMLVKGGRLDPKYNITVPDINARQSESGGRG
ncbi:MAG: type IV toxin-antitoxin system AbiEi family antitoxin [Acidobacteriia bacterium]|nr:type IV toxin-antitoxin system AbiEi family antitoxin [Terriglobia bacterium]